MAVDYNQQNFRIVGGGNGIIYAFRSDGVMSIFRHTDWMNGSAMWANGGSGVDIGSGLQGYSEIIGGHDGTLFCLDTYGNVDRYRFVITNLTTLAGYWENNGSPVRVGTGFGGFARVFGGPDGVIWATKWDGTLWRSVYANGTLSALVQVGNGFNGWSGADAGGVVYNIRDGVLNWMRYVNGVWQNNGMPIQIGDSGWGNMTDPLLFAAGNGLFYWIKVDGGNPPGLDHELGWLRLANYQGVAAAGGPSWANGGNSRIVGNGFTVEPNVQLQGYCWPQSATHGETVGVKVSSSLGSLAVTVLQLAPGETQTKMTLPNLNAQLQMLQSNFRERGCGWATSTTVMVPADWPSGVYAVQVKHPAGGRTIDLPFVVKPTAPTARVAVIVNTLTYHAYNAWSSRSQYTGAPTSGLRKLSLQRPSYAFTENGMWSDLLLLRWLTEHGYVYDAWADQDLHENPGMLTDYEAVVTGMHPEYATDAMRQAYSEYAENGGCLIYAGGNGLYERVALSDDGTQVIFRHTDGRRDVFSEHGQPMSGVFGVEYDDSGWNTFAPYKVVVDHALLHTPTETGLTVGSVFGTSGYNGAASGLEYDVRPAGGPGTLIAVGQNLPAKGNAAGANMLLIEGPNGGFVFSAASMTFAGALPYDQALSDLFDNVMQRAVPTPPAP